MRLTPGQGRGGVIGWVLPALALVAPPAPAAGEHPFPDVYIHYHLDLAPGELILSHETRWTDLVATSLCRRADTDGDGTTSAAEVAAFVREWTAQVRRTCRVTVDGRPVELGEPEVVDESLAWFADKGKESMATAEWEINLDFRIPLESNAGERKLVIEDDAYRGAREGDEDVYWLTNQVGVVGEEGLRILQVTEKDDPMYVDRRFEVRWDWQGEGIAAYTPDPLVNPNAESRDRMIELLERAGSNSWFLPLALLLAAFYGMVHALAPGHGKAMVAGYLVGSSGRIRDAVLLGLVVTLTHTATVLILALCVYILRDRFPYKSFELWLPVCSGALITSLGVWLLVRRMPGSASGHHGHDHGHDHGHGHGHDHHHHGGEPVSLAQLLWLGVSGGVVPCPAALVVLLFSFNANLPGEGLAIVLAFSLGLAGVLVAIGVALVTSKGLLQRWSGGADRLGPILRWLPAISAVSVTLVGVVITWQGWPGR